MGLFDSLLPMSLMYKIPLFFLTNAMSFIGFNESKTGDQMRKYYAGEKLIDKVLLTLSPA